MAQKKWIYLDHAATTPVRPEAAEAMLPFLHSCFGNPSAAYSFSETPRRAIADARTAAAALIGAHADEIYFTGGGTESDNWALTAAVEVYRSDSAAGRRDKSTVSGDGSSPLPHIITTRIEHPAVLRTCEYLERRGFSVTYLDVDAEGFVSPADVEAAVRPETAVISVMMANNEIGTIEPVREIGEIAHRHGILFHTDAVQAAGHIPIDVDEMNIDLLSASGHKFGGPKGAGFLYIRRGIPFQAFIRGGGQERGRRAGTENVPGIAGMGKAAELAAAGLAAVQPDPGTGEAVERDREGRKISGTAGPASYDRVRFLRDSLVHRILTQIPDSHLNGPALSEFSAADHADKSSPAAQTDRAGRAAGSAGAATTDTTDRAAVATGTAGSAGTETAGGTDAGSGNFVLRRLPGNANITFDGVSSESLLIALDMKGVCVSAGSACSSGALDPSHVLTAIGLEPEAAKSTIRLTVGEENTLDEIDEAVEIIGQAVKRIRSLAAELHRL